MQLRSAVANGKNICLDATNVKRRNRKRLIRLGREYNAYVEAIYFKVPNTLALKRNMTRPADSHIPSE